MILIDGPYVSDFLKETLYRTQTEVVRTAASELYLDAARTHYISETDAQSILRSHPDTLVYTNSENALDWLHEHLAGSTLVQTIQEVKDKVVFRERLAALHPDYDYAGYELEMLYRLDPEKLNFPLILKPAVGFFSLGVQRIESREVWAGALTRLRRDIQESEDLYPQRVLDNRHFILESIIPGDEFAIDCYFDAQGHPVVLNIMQHLFASATHMNDRIYYTSGKIIEAHLPQVLKYLEQLGQLFHFQNFPAHIELRIQGDQVQAIEVNPLRFGGWCSTADMAFYAWGMNLYEAVLTGLRPDWKKLSADNMDHIHALLVLDNSTGVPGSQIKEFDYSTLLRQISEPLELRRTDFRKFPVFGFLMCRVAADALHELQPMLHSDLSEYVRL